MPGRGSRAQAGAAALLVGAMAWRVSGPAHVARDISLAMDLIGDPYYDRLRQAVGLAEAKDSSYAAVPEVANEEELAMLLRSRVPFVLALIGVVGLALILWLMVFKPL